MNLSSKRAPQVTNPEVSRAVQEIYKEINALVDAVNQNNRRAPASHTEGKPGDIRVVKGADSKYYLEAKFDDGWATTAAGAMDIVSRVGERALSPTPSSPSGTIVAGGRALELPTIDLATSGATPGSYSFPVITVDQYGRITSVANGTAVGSFFDLPAIADPGNPVHDSVRIWVIVNGATLELRARNELGTDVVLASWAEVAAGGGTLLFNLIEP